MTPAAAQARLDRRSATTDWLGPLTTGLSSLGRPELATLVLAVIRGLLLDLDATGDVSRTTEAFDDFLDAVLPSLGHRHA